MDYARILAEGVGSWLTFEYACDRSGLFSEKYLTQPIGQILSARSANRAHAEYKHPILAALAKGAGRRPEIDFAVTDPHPKVSIAVESKWIGKTRPTVQSIFWDLIRLELIAHEHKARCFFVIGGKRSDLNELFALKSFAGGYGKRPLMLSNRNIPYKAYLVPHLNERVPLLKELFVPYQDVEFPHTLLTRRTAPFPLDGPGKDPQVYVWEVLCATQRRTFRPRNSKHYAADGKGRRERYRQLAKLARSGDLP